MITYQDLVEVGTDENKRMAFVRDAINQHKSSDLYKTAKIADEYYKGKNTTIVQFEKTLTTITGNTVPDRWSPNHKVTSRYFKRFVTQQNQFLLGNGVTWQNEDTEKRVGKHFDTKLQELGLDALNGAISFGFLNLDKSTEETGKVYKLDVFAITEFKPLMDEENGSLRAGIRFWQIDDTKPLRATLYEEDGYTNYIWRNKDGKENGEIIGAKQKYIKNLRTSEIDGTEILDGENYPGFPIVPLWGNPEHQSEIVGIRGGIDSYDLIKNGYLNELDNAQVYWLIKGAGGMDDPDLARFLERLKFTHAAAPADGQEVDAVTVDIPYEAREKLLDRIEKDLYRDYMAFDSDRVASGAATATEIIASYEAMNSKADLYEYQILQFLEKILELAGIDDKPSFTRSYMINKQEDVQTVVSAGTYLPDDYVTEKVLTILGDGDRVEEILKQQDADEIERLRDVPVEEESEEETEEVAE